MVRSLMITYVSVGSIFNAYILSVAAIALFSQYDKRYNSLNWLAGDQHTALHNFLSTQTSNFYSTYVTLCLALQKK